MSHVFFEQLRLVPPDYNLGVQGGTHGQQTADMLRECERVLLNEKPDWVLVYGDTNSTLAGALAAAKLHIRVAHVEAGLRSFNREMPEEINRVLTDHVADLLLVPTKAAADNLCREGVSGNVEVVGDVMLDAILEHAAEANQNSTILKDMHLTARRYTVATVHRAENTDNLERLQSIVNALASIATDETIVWPVHPRIRAVIHSRSERFPEKLKLVAPIPYFDMLTLVANAQVVMTDSGGLQKEAFWLRVPCITMRSETEWVETVASGWNRLAGCSHDGIVRAYRETINASRPKCEPLEDKGAAARIVGALTR
jgi:UDP-N-acetylglucosamine 2-epimerase